MPLKKTIMLALGIVLGISYAFAQNISANISDIQRLSKEKQIVLKAILTIKTIKISIPK